MGRNRRSRRDLASCPWSALSNHGETTHAQTAAIVVERAQQAIAGILDVFGRLTRGGLGLVAPDKTENAAMLGPGLLARRFGPDFEPAGARQPRHGACDRLDQKGVAGKPGDFDMKVSANAMPLFPGHAGPAGVQHLLD